jgi:hypothetical protein
MKKPNRQRNEGERRTGSGKLIPDSAVVRAGIPATVLVVPMKILAKPEPIKHTRK